MNLTAPSTLDILALHHDSRSIETDAAVYLFYNVVLVPQLSSL